MSNDKETSLGEVVQDEETEIHENQKDILFFDAPYHTDQELSYSLIKDSGENMDLPRGMLSIASNLKEQGVSADVIPLDSYLYPDRSELMTNGEFDQAKLKEAIEKIIDEKIDKSNPKVVAFGLMYTFVEPIVLQMTRHAKEKYPNKYVIVGGNHATFSDLELLDPENSTGIDIVVRFEGEATTQELMTELSMPSPDLLKVKGISFRDNNGIVHQNEPRDRADLYQMPPLDYSLIDSPEGLDKFNQTAMFLRGCRGNCAFCTSPRYWNRELTRGREKNFEEEIEYLARNGVEIISVLDDDILASEEGFNSIMNSLRKVKAKFPDIKFIAQTRVIHLRDKENPEAREKCQNQLTQIHEVGISRLYLGIESGSQEILAEMSKGYKLDWVEQALKNVHGARIETGAFWLFGHPGATAEKEEESLLFMQRILSEGLLEDVEAHCVVPFPGTRISQDPRIQIFDHDKKHYGLLNNYPVYDLIDPETREVTLSAAKIKGFLDRALELRRQYLGVETDVANKSV